MSKIDLCNASAGEFAKLMDQALRLGASDETAGRPLRTGSDLAVHFCSNWRNGHARALRQAYAAGRFHIQCMQTPKSFDTRLRALEASTQELLDHYGITS